MSDTNKWDRRYLAREHETDLTPDSLLVENADLFRNSDLVVDLACGTGRHSIYLAKLGCFVVALDCSSEALRRCKEFAKKSNVRIHGVVADLTDTRFPPETVDAIVCFNYLNRELASNLQIALKPGGLLIMKTFNRNFQQVNSRFNPAYMLTPGELSIMYGDLQVIQVNDGCTPASNTTSFIVAQKPMR